MGEKRSNNNKGKEGSLVNTWVSQTWLSCDAFAQICTLSSSLRDPTWEKVTKESQNSRHWRKIVINRMHRSRPGIKDGAGCRVGSGDPCLYPATQEADLCSLRPACSTEWLQGQPRTDRETVWGWGSGRNKWSELGVWRELHFQRQPRLPFSLSLMISDRRFVRWGISSGEYSAVASSSLSTAWMQSLTTEGLNLSQTIWEHLNVSSAPQHPSHFSSPKNCT